MADELTPTQASQVRAVTQFLGGAKLANHQIDKGQEGAVAHHYEVEGTGLKVVSLSMKAPPGQKGVITTTSILYPDGNSHSVVQDSSSKQHITVHGDGRTVVVNGKAVEGPTFASKEDMSFHHATKPVALAPAKRPAPAK